MLKINAPGFYFQMPPVLDKSLAEMEAADSAADVAEENGQFGRPGSVRTKSPD